jgi:hypothetical protein
MLRRASDQNPVHSVAQAFAITTLYLLVQPRPKLDWVAAEAICKNGGGGIGPAAGAAAVRRSCDDNFGILMFAYVGWDVYPFIPSNSHIRHECGGGEAAGCCAGDEDAGGCGGCGNWKLMIKKPFYQSHSFFAYFLNRRMWWVRRLW